MRLKILPPQETRQVAVLSPVDRQVSYFHLSFSFSHYCVRIAFERPLIMFYSNRLNPSESLLWSQSLENLLRSKYGMATFHTFLKSEFSDENIEFWLVCEDFKKIRSSSGIQI
uniref:Regulator of G protein signaling 13 n=1 Tax=Sinocyclocheilus grahami TaxID=75366 RepID=A0A672M402_SINGR